MAVITERCTDGIVKPLPPEWFVPKDASAEMRREAMQGQGYFVPPDRFFVRNHTSTPRRGRPRSSAPGRRAAATAECGGSGAC
jgi:hypothetical protein